MICDLGGSRWEAEAEDTCLFWGEVRILTSLKSLAAELRLVDQRKWMFDETRFHPNTRNQFRILWSDVVVR